MEEIPTFVSVVAALIRDGEGRILLQQALPGKRHAGLWELPGGKLDRGETPRGALVREIDEELGITLEAEALLPAGFTDEAREEGRAALVLFLYTCGRWSGMPEGREGQQWGWFSWPESLALPLAPMDRELLDRLGSVGRS